MTERHDDRSVAFPRGFDGHRRNQAGIGLSMSPAERLRWLQETTEAMRRWQGRARAKAPSPRDD